VWDKYPSFKILDRLLYYTLQTCRLKSSWHSNRRCWSWYTWYDSYWPTYWAVSTKSVSVKTLNNHRGQELGYV
jgi:hypothetical protein